MDLQTIVCPMFQADLDGDRFIQDLKTNVMSQSAFDAIVRVRTSQGKLDHHLINLLIHICWFKLFTMKVRVKYMHESCRKADIL